jgi:hypothetical protein
LNKLWKTKCICYFPWNEMGPNNSYNPITNTAWVRVGLCKLQKRVHATRSCKWYNLPVACPWSVVLRFLPPLRTGRHDIAEILLKVTLNTKNQMKSNLVKHIILDTMSVVCTLSIRQYYFWSIHIHETICTVNSNELFLVIFFLHILPWM